NLATASPVMSRMSRLIPAGKGASAAACSVCPCGHIAKCSRWELAKRHETSSRRMFQNLREFGGRCHAWGGGMQWRCVAACRRETPLVAGRRAWRAGIVWRLDRSDAAWGQISETLPEVTVSAPRPVPRPPRRPAPAPRRAAPSPPETSGPAPAPAVSALPAFQVVAPTPITGLGFDRSKVPAMVQTLPAEDFSRVYSPNVVETFVQRIPGVSTNNVQGNEFATDLRYRGFAASPLQGTPQGLAVYMQGIRVNEAFGDTVNWDLIPKVAIGRSDIWTNNPTFGLNALGGAISFQMKDGFTYSGTEFDASGGSYGRVGGSLQYGVRNGEWGLYLAAEGLKDDGWRLQSPSQLARFYGGLGWKGTDAEIHLVTSAADNFFGVIGPTPIELLANDYRAIFTWPQTTKNEAALVALNGRYSVTDHWTVQSNLYYRR